VSLETFIALLGWGTLVGVDLVSVPQMMIARPLVAGTVAGAILGDLDAGLKIGVVFELLQYDILPVGAVRYPEYGPATVAAVATAHAAAGALGLGLGTVVGLVTGLVGGISMHLMRRINSRIVHAASPALESGDPRALMRLHVGGVLRDGVRAALVTALGLALAWTVPPHITGVLSPRAATLLAVAAVASALAAGSAGTIRLVGRGPNLAWFAAGLGGGLIVAVWLR
jgi:PTS system mannose-specific IIC component